MKLIESIFEILCQTLATIIIYIVDEERDHFFISNSKELETFSIINQD
ncbi:hypothetical protein [Halobacteriovorax sp. HLS]|nr:hypothetical protein [Halobacteriovorax sp. HLS]